MSDDGGDDSPPRPKRKIKKVVLMSSESESDSDESIAAAATRRKRLRVASDDGGESSGSSVVAGVRRNRPLPKLRDSDGDSDTSGWATDHSDAHKPAPSTAKPTSGFASDSSEGNSDKCSICLLRFTNQEIGTPQSCEHIFCLDCITEWSKNVNTCPVDRMSFDSIVVRSFNGGRVLRTEPVKVVERRPSIELLVTEDPTVCEVCGSTENEETMLLCDGCDLGYHMQCLTPPLLEIPPDQWLCPNCDELLSDVDILFSGMTDTGIDIALDSRRNSRQSRGVRSGNRIDVDEPSTSTSHGSSQSASSDFPSTSRGSTSRASGSRASHRRHYRRPRRRRTRTVIIEYEIEENGKFPVTKRVKRKLKKRKTKRRQPRTVARRTHVRASVRAKLATQSGSGTAAAAGPASLGVRRQRAGIAPLRLFGDPHQLDYFSEEDDPGVSEGATTAVAVRPTAAILSAYRQSRRKMINIPSPPHASAAPDILSSIMESQTLLHSKKSVVSVTVDGSVNIKLEKRERQSKPAQPQRHERVDPARAGAGAAAREVPSYPGQSRGGWGGGYRYRDAPGPTGGAYQNNGYGGGYQHQPQHQPRQADAAGDGRRGPDAYDAYSRRPPQPFADDAAFDRRRDHARFPPQHERRQSGPGPGPGPGPWRAYAPPAPHRHSFGGFENPLDMRVARAARPPAPYRPLPEPPVFKFDGPPDVERSEDERSDPDPDLVIDTDKYDPTEPTNDDDSPDEAAQPLGPQLGPAAEPAPRPQPEPEPQPQAAPLPAGVLDVAVRQVLQEHRGLLAPPSARSDDDSDGDCPNFSIYSAASVHIANSSTASASAAPALPAPPPPSDGMEDLVQQDDPPDDPPDPPPQPPPAPRPAPAPRLKKSDLELKEKVSKRCPITTNPRNPIKIKLNTPSLIRRQVSLYDEEEEDVVEEPEDEPEPEPEPEPVAAPAPLEGDRRTREPDADEGRENALDEHDAEKETRQPDADPKLEDPGERIHEGQASPGTSPSPEPKGSPTRRDPSPEGDDPARSTEAECGHFSDDERDAAERQAHTPTDARAGDRHSESSDDERVEGGDEPRETIAPEKMTESISETEDERSYTPCLDENKSKDTSLETDKDKALEGLDTELISEDEANGVFSDGERPEAAAPSPGDTPASAPASAVAAASAEGGDSPPGSVRRKRKKDAKRDGKDKKKAKREKAAKEVAFKKPSRSGKERNYRDKDRDKDRDAERDRERRDSGDAAERKRRRKEKRKDLERYDVRTVVTEKRRRPKDAFGRDVSPRARARSRSASDPPEDARRSASEPRRLRRSPSPPAPRRRSPSPAAARRRSASRGRGTPPRPRRSPTPARRRASSSPRRPRRTPSPASPRAPAASPARPRRRRRDPEKRPDARRRRSPERRKRRRSGSPPRVKPGKRRKRARSERSSRRRRASAGAGAGPPAESPAGRSPSRASVDSRLLSPRTPPPEPSPSPPPPAEERRRREPERPRHRRGRDAPGPSKEVFTSGDNILVSVSFDAREPEGEARRERRRERRRRRRRAAPEPDAAPRPVAVIDLARSPFRELTPSPRDVIVLSDSEGGAEAAPADAGAPAAPPPDAAAPGGPGPGTPPEPPDSPDAYDPYEPTRSASASPSPRPDPPRTLMTLETAQKTNMSADEVIDRRPVSPIEKVMALLQSTRDVSPEPPPAGDAPAAAESEQPPEPSAAQPPALLAPPAPAAPLAAPAAPAAAPALAPPIRIVLPSPTRAQPPKLFLAKPSPIKSDPIKPMQAAKLARPPPRVSPAGDSPYSPGSSDFGDLFSPPGGGGGGGGGGSLGGERARPRRARGEAAKVPVKLDRQARRGKTHVGVKVDEDNLKILDDLPSSAVEMQVKSKFLKKLNRQERVVDEVKLVLKPHYNKKHVTKDEYKDILRRAVPKICHNKTGEINPAKIQALVEAYVKRIRKKHKLGLS